MTTARYIMSALFALAALCAFAFRPPIDTADGLEVEVEGFREKEHPFLGIREVEPNERLDYTVAVRNKRKEAVTGTLSTWLNDDWTAQTNPVPVTVASGGTVRIPFSAQPKPIDRKGYWCYPIHARLVTPKDDLHAIAIFKPKGGTGAYTPPGLPQPPAFGAPPEGARSREFTLAGGYRASVTPGEHGLQDGRLSFKKGNASLALTGFEINIDRTNATVVAARVEKTSGGFAVLHDVRLSEGRTIVVRATVSVRDRALSVAWDMPGTKRDRRGSPRFTRLAVGNCSRAVYRAYLGFGNVVERPGEFHLPAISNTLSGRHVGADYDGGLSLVQAVKISPDFLVHRTKGKSGADRFALEADCDNEFLFLPSVSGAFEAAHAFSRISGYRKGPGVDSVIGKTYIDQLSGDYSDTADKIKRLVDLGVDDAFLCRHLWQRWGFDYRFPEICPASGDTNAFARMVRTAQDLGIRFVPHTNYTDFYPDAEGFSYDKVQFREDGRPRSGWFSKPTGALAYFWLPSAIHGALAKNQRLMREQFAPQGVYIDVFTAMTPVDYFDREGNYHTRVEMTREWAKACDYARSTMGDGKGPVLSEGGTDHLIGHVDGSQTDHYSADRWLKGDYADAERVPWQDMVTHGKMLMLGGGFENRYAATTSDEALDMRLHGFGSDDYIVTTVMGGRSPMTELSMWSAVKTHWTLHDICAELARREFERHEFVGGNIHRQRMTFSGGAFVVANRGDGDWEIEGRVIPKYGFYARAGGVEAGIVRIGGQRVAFSKSPDARFYDARPPLGHDGSKPAHVEVVNAEHRGDGMFDVTYRITLYADGLERYKPFLMFQKAVGGKPSAHEVYACHGALEIPVEKMKHRGTFEVVGHHRLPPRLDAGDYTLHFGFFVTSGAARMDISGPGVLNGRIWGGTFSIAKEGDRIVSGKWTPADTMDKDNPLELNVSRKLVDFGDDVKTDGAFRIMKRDGRRQIVPMPGCPRFKYVIKGKEGTR